MRWLVAFGLAACAGKASSGVELVDAPPGTTDVAAVVRATAEHVANAHRRLFVYVGASWCEPCQQIHAAIVDHRLDETFPDLTLLVFDLDRDGPALEAAGYTSPLIPLFEIPGPDGRAGPRKVFGGKHDGDNVKLLTDKLHTIYD